MMRNDMTSETFLYLFKQNWHRTRWTAGWTDSRLALTHFHAKATAGSPVHSIVEQKPSNCSTALHFGVYNAKNDSLRLYISGDKIGAENYFYSGVG